MAPNVPNDDPHWLRSNKAKLAILLAIIPIIGAIVTGITLEWFKSSNGTSEPTGKPSSSVSSSPVGGPPAGDSPTTPALGSSPSLDVQYLSDLKAVDKGFGVEIGGAEIDKKQYAHSVSVAVGACSNSDHAVTYNIESDWKTFTTWVGLSEKSEKRYRIFFQVYVDEKPVPGGYTTEADVWAPAYKIEVPISSAHQIKLTATWMKGGECNDGNVSYATWGEAMFTK
ncbi:NPCBM/NEW2 domain-containing protein [Spirillospora sp. CA-128828]|uniref:NPCBM/NEW2 domain-containing protein n=1 Tax=Spirillospora sp. CA-128828 TaxID=3240033 RepID=UPI003D9156D5